MTEKVKQWITDFAMLGEPSVDALDCGEGCALSPMGKQVVQEFGTILGKKIRNVRYHWRLKFHLRRVPRLGDDLAAERLAALSTWLAYASGDLLDMENARLVAQTEAMSRYEADLYMTVME